MIDKRTTKSAVYLLDEDFVRTVNHPVPSGWDYDQRGAIDPFVHSFGRSFRLSTDKEHNNPTVISRNFLPLTSGRADFEMSIVLHSGSGLFIDFSDIDGKSCLKLVQDKTSLLCAGECVPAPITPGYYHLAIDFCLDCKNAVLYINGKKMGQYPLSASSLANLKIGYPSEAEGDCTVFKCALYINYLVCDKNLMNTGGNLPEKWTVKTNGNARAYSSSYHEAGAREHTYVLHAAKNASACAKRSFEKSSGKVCFELKFLPFTEDENITFSLLCGDEKAVTVIDKGTMSTKADGTLLRKHHTYVWQTLRIEADTDTGKALVRHNGVNCGEISFCCSSFDGISIEYAPSKDGYMRFTDVCTFVIQPEPADYPKPPVRPTKNGYPVGINVCSLWRNGEHWGWDAISNFDDNKVLLGTYDEPFTEVADWEIKWMVEHGIDAQFYCWFENYTTAPIFKTHICGALDDGYFNAKYCDEMSFALIWEASNASSPNNLESFKKYLVPYWIDHYFSHPNYFRINNVAILSVFGINKVVDRIGGAEILKTAFDYLRGVLKDIGYDDLFIMTCGEPSDVLADAGVNAVYAYNWGHQSFSVEYTKGRIAAQRVQDRLHVVPTACVGYNDVAWREFRSPVMLNEDLGELLTYFKNELLPDYKVDDEWKKKFIMTATWNEYGEGTYICPTFNNGFGYLNEIRKAFTVEGDAFDSDVPTGEAFDRLGYLYPRGRAILQAPLLEKPDTSASDVFMRIVFPVQEAVEEWKFEGEGFIKHQNGKLYGESVGNDPKIILETNFNASEVSIIKIKMRAVNGEAGIDAAKPYSSSVFCHYTTDESPEWHYNKQLDVRDLDDEGYYIFYTSDSKLWNGKITNFRIDPCNNVGKFEFEEILFIGGNKDIYETFIDGVRYNSHYLSKVEDGETYVIFEPLRDFTARTVLYHEWDVETKTLMIQHGDTKSYWTEGSDIVKVDGKDDIKLKKPLEFFDHLPYIEMTAFCKFTGYKCSINEKRIDITTK